MKRTCEGCRAYERIPTGKYGGVEYQCSLHYPQANGKPLQWCPKPTTVRELAVLSCNTALLTIMDTKPRASAP
jgi:hypothetical protein